MPIVSSEIVADQVQIDGRRHVQERHVDHLGQVLDVFYMAEAAADTSVALQARVAVLEAQLAEAELAANEAEVLS